MEAALFYLILIVAGIFDIKSMVKNGAKKEIAPYIALALLAGAFGLYLLNPTMESISYYFISFFKLEE
jgi:hypothetical protein